MLRFKKVHPDGKLTKGFDPEKKIVADPDAAGYDLYCIEDVIIGIETKKVPTGIAVEIPKGWVGIIRDRSSIGSKGVIVSGGVIDSSYRGEVLVCLTALNSLHVREFRKGERIAQMIVVPHFIGQPVEVPELTKTERGEGGFGSTGR